MHLSEFGLLATATISAPVEPLTGLWKGGDERRRSALVWKLAIETSSMEDVVAVQLETSKVALLWRG